MVLILTTVSLGYGKVQMVAAELPDRCQPLAGRYGSAECR